MSDSLASVALVMTEVSAMSVFMWSSSEKERAAVSKAAGEMWDSTRSSTYAAIGQRLMSQAVKGFEIPRNGPEVEKAQKLVAGASDKELSSAFVANSKRRFEASLESLSLPDWSEPHAKSIPLDRGTDLIAKEMQIRGIEEPGRDVTQLGRELSPLEAKWASSMKSGLAMVHAITTNQSLTALSRDGFEMPAKGEPGREVREAAINLSSAEEIDVTLTNTGKAIDRLSEERLVNQTIKAMEKDGVDKLSISAQQGYAKDFANLSFEERTEKSQTFGLSRNDQIKLSRLVEGESSINAEVSLRYKKVQQIMAMETSRRMDASMG